MSLTSAAYNIKWLFVFFRYAEYKLFDDIRENYFSLIFIFTMISLLISMQI